MTDSVGPVALTAHSVLRRSLHARVRNFRGQLSVAVADRSVTLDEVGEFIFRQLDGTSSIGAVGSALAAEYGISDSEAVADTLDLLGELHGLALVTVL